MPCSSLLSDCEAGSSSPESSAKGGMEKKKKQFPWLPLDCTSGQGDLLPPPAQATGWDVPGQREGAPSPALTPRSPISLAPLCMRMQSMA